LHRGRSDAHQTDLQHHNPLAATRRYGSSRVISASLLSFNMVPLQ